LVLKFSDDGTLSDSELTCVMLRVATNRRDSIIFCFFFFFSICFYFLCLYSVYDFRTIINKKGLHDSSCICSREVEERMNKLQLEVETLSQSEQMATKSQADEDERVTKKY